MRTEAEYRERAEAACADIHRLYRAEAIRTHIACAKAFDRQLDFVAKTDAAAAKRMVADEMRRAA